MKESTAERARIYAAMFADATSAVARLREGSRTREDVAAALLPFKAMRREGATIEGHGLISFWGMWKELDGAREFAAGCRMVSFEPGGCVLVVDEGDAHENEISEDAEMRYFEAWEGFAARRDIPADVAELMRYAAGQTELALCGCEYAKEEAAGRGIYRDFTPGHYNDIVDRMEIEMLKLSGSGGDCAHGKRVSKYLGRERQSDQCEVMPDENSKAGAIYAEWQRFKNGRASDFSDESGRNVRKVGQKRTMEEFYNAKKDKPLSAIFPNHLKTYVNNSFAEFKRIVERVRKAIERERKK